MLSGMVVRGQGSSLGGSVTPGSVARLVGALSRLSFPYPQTVSAQLKAEPIKGRQMAGSEIPLRHW